MAKIREMGDQVDLVKRELGSRDLHQELTLLLSPEGLEGQEREVFQEKFKKDQNMEEKVHQKVHQ